MLLLTIHLNYLKTMTIKGWVVECEAPDPLSLCLMPTETDVG